MDENNLNNSNNSTYYAKTNLNTAIENPQINLNSATGLNIQNSNNVDSNMNRNAYSSEEIFQNKIDYNNQVGSNLNSSYGENSNYGGFNNNYESNTSNLNSSDYESNSNNLDGNSYADEMNENSTYVADAKIGEQSVNNYVPTLEKKKKPKTGLVISKELKMMIVIIVVLVAFIMITPYIYDYLKELNLIITSG